MNDGQNINAKAPSQKLREDIVQYRKEMEDELKDILDYWMEFTIDKTNKGFFGGVDNNNIPDKNAYKGIVLNARILWAFSAAYNLKGEQSYLIIAERAFNYILTYFNDKEYGGVYWSVDANGKKHDDKKQIYGLAFCIYGMSEYYVATKNETALNYAVELYKLIEKYSYDKNYKGYLEAFSRDWQVIDDLRLSTKDANEAKTTNTHLHVIEGYANLYKVWNSEELKAKIIELLELFDDYFIDRKTSHLRLFFDEEWNEKPDVISYGHDIEAAWLLQQCAEIIGDDKWIKVFKQYALSIANATKEGVDADGGLWYELDTKNNKLIKEKHSWPQAEAMIGFYNAYQISYEGQYLELSKRSWNFVKKYILDTVNGEWFWGRNGDYSLMQKEKAGFWKCPYHNSRACIEIIRRIDSDKK